MIGAPIEARWTCAEPRRTLPPPVLDRIVATAFPRAGVVEATPLFGGQRNSNFVLRVERKRAPIVLRIYEHDPMLCRKELDLMRMMRDSVPVPEVFHAEPDGSEGIPPFLFMQFVEGINLRDVARSGDQTAMAEAARSAGEILAAIGMDRKFKLPPLPSFWIRPPQPAVSGLPWIPIRGYMSPATSVP
jgi:aminoglycoside phosphotransferase (APT) family kinase protein